MINHSETEKNRLYAKVVEEIKAGQVDQAIWLRAVAETGNDQKPAKALYAKLRVEDIQRQEQDERKQREREEQERQAKLRKMEKTYKKAMRVGRYDGLKAAIGSFFLFILYWLLFAIPAWVVVAILSGGFITGNGESAILIISSIAAFIVLRWQLNKAQRSNSSDEAKTRKNRTISLQKKSSVFLCWLFATIYVLIIWLVLKSMLSINNPDIDVLVWLSAIFIGIYAARCEVKRRERLEQQ